MNRDISALKAFDVRLCDGGPPVKPGADAPGAAIAVFRFNADISPLFPYINAVVDRAELFLTQPFIRFARHGWYFGLHPQKGAATPVTGWEEVEPCLNCLTGFLAEIDAGRNDIVPDPKGFCRGSVPDILLLLPRNNCGRCGFPTCVAFAAALSQQRVGPDRCPHMGFPLSEQAIYPVYDAAGKLEKTVAIRIDADRVQRAYRKQTRYVDQLEKTIGTLSRRRQGDVEKANSALPAPLTDRELEVLRMVAGGATNSEISETLDISPHTVKSHVVHIFNKLGVNDRTQAAVWATRANLV